MFSCSNIKWQKKTVYVVFKGRQLGIYNSWPECQEQVNGYRDNLYQSYPTLEEAEVAFLEYIERRMKKPLEPEPMNENIEATHTRVNVNNEWINGFVLGCIIGILLMSVFSYWLHM